LTQLLIFTARDKEMKTLTNNTWVWVIVQDPDRDEQFLGQYDEVNKISFVPFFLEKEEAVQCISGLVKNPGHTYEIQAVLFEELKRFCAEDEVMLFLLNNKGEILDKIPPG